MPNESPTLAVRDPRYERWRWQIFAITWLAYAGLYLTRKSFAVAKIGISKDPALKMSDVTMGWIDFVNLAAYAVGQVLFGMAGDKVGPRRVVLGGMIVSVLASIAMGASHVVIVMGVLLCIQGFCQAVGWGPLTKNVSTFFSRRERGTVMGLWCTNYPIGGLLALLLAGYAGDRWGWRYAFYVPAMGLAVVAVLFALFQRNRPEDVGLVPVEAYHGESGTLGGMRPQQAERGIWGVLTNRMVLLLAFTYFLLKPARYAILAWGPKYINARLNTGMAESGLVSAMFELAGAPGALLAGYLSDNWFGSRRVPVCVVALALLGVALFALDKMPASRVLIGGCLFAIGFLLFAADSLVAGAASVDFGTKRGASTAAGFVNAVGSIGGMVGGSVPGFVNKRWGWGGVFQVLGVMAIVAAMVMLPRWNAVPKSESERQ